MIIKNGNIFGKDGRFQKGNLHIQGEKIVNKSEEGRAVDATDLYVIPGLIDTHIHGCMGHDFCEGTHEAIEVMGKYLLSQGITAFLPTTMSLNEKQLEKIFESYGSYKYQEGALPIGIHMEGPFFEDGKKGAQNGAYLKNADQRLYEKLQSLSKNNIKIVSLSPVVKGALAFIERNKDKVVLSLAHTTADYELASKAFSKGAKRVTHLYNGMITPNHRKPGVAGAAFDYPETYVELICDGIHVHESVIRSTFAMYTDERIVLISDNMMAAGMKDGSYELGGQKVEVKGPKALLKDGTIAGSVTNLMQCMRNAVDFGIPLESAIKAVTINAAKSIGVIDQMGSLECGKLANIVLLDKNLQAKAVYIKGIEFKF